MASNPFFIEPASPLQALMMGQQGYDRAQKATQDMSLRRAGELFAQGDLKGAQAAAAQGGSLQALMGFSGLANNDRDYAFRQQEAERSQKNTEASRVLQERGLNQSAAHQAAAQALARQQFAWQQEQGNRPEVQMVEDEMGRKIPVLIDRKTMAVRPLTTGGVFATPPAGAPQTQPPAASSTAEIAPLPFKPTDTEKNDLSKATSAYQILDRELQNYEGLIKQHGVSFWPGTEERTKYDTARRNIQMQMKELYNLGVLNGPDLALMDQMLVNPTTQSSPDAGITQQVLDTASAPIRAFYKSFMLQGQAKANIGDLRASMRNMYEAKRDTVLRRPRQTPQPPASNAAGQAATPALPPGFQLVK